MFLKHFSSHNKFVDEKNNADIGSHVEKCGCESSVEAAEALFSMDSPESRGCICNHRQFACLLPCSQILTGICNQGSNQLGDYAASQTFSRSLWGRKTSDTVRSKRTKRQRPGRVIKLNNSRFSRQVSFGL